MCEVGITDPFSTDQETDTEARQPHLQERGKAWPGCCTVPLLHPQAHSLGGDAGPGLDSRSHRHTTPDAPSLLPALPSDPRYGQGCRGPSGLFAAVLGTLSPHLTPFVTFHYCLSLSLSHEGLYRAFSSLCPSLAQSFALSECYSDIC